MSTSCRSAGEVGMQQLPTPPQQQQIHRHAAPLYLPAAPTHLHAGCVELDGDAALALQIHAVQILSLQRARGSNKRTAQVGSRAGCTAAAISPQRPAWDRSATKASSPRAPHCLPPTTARQAGSHPAPTCISRSSTVSVLISSWSASVDLPAAAGCSTRKQVGTHAGTHAGTHVPQQGPAGHGRHTCTPTSAQARSNSRMQAHRGRCGQ